MRLKCIGMQCHHKSAGAAFTVLAILHTHKNKKCNTQVSKSGSECVSVNLNRNAPGPPRYAGAFGPIP